MLQAMPPSRLNTVILTFLALLLIWAPIPLGSNRPWAWAILEIAIAFVFVLHLIQYLRQPFSLTYLKWQLPLLMPLLIFQFYLALQVWQLIPSVETIIATNAALKDKLATNPVPIDFKETGLKGFQEVAFTTAYAYLIY